MKTFLYVIRAVYIIQMVHPFCITSSRMWNRCWTRAKTKDSGHEQVNWVILMAITACASQWGWGTGCPGESRTYTLQTHWQGVIIKLGGAENWKLFHCRFVVTFFFSFFLSFSQRVLPQQQFRRCGYLKTGCWVVFGTGGGKTGS